MRVDHSRVAVHLRLEDQAGPDGGAAAERANIGLGSRTLRPSRPRSAQSRLDRLTRVRGADLERPAQHALDVAQPALPGERNERERADPLLGRRQGVEPSGSEHRFRQVDRQHLEAVAGEPSGRGAFVPLRLVVANQEQQLERVREIDDW